MRKFFEDVMAFRKDLKTTARSAGRCWSCSCRSPNLLSPNLIQDFTTLEIPTQGCQPRIPFCPQCAAAYFNSFNAALDKTRSEPVNTPAWTPEKILKMMRETCP